jgi:phospholipase A2-like protein
MKRWMRPVLAILLGVLAAGYLGIVPAQAAKPAAKTETVVTYRGYTLSWSEPDASDLRVVRTPGRAESFPAAASERSIRQARSRVESAASQESAADSCTGVPDSFGEADFTRACDTHDDCYSFGTTFSRLECDRKLLFDLRAACTEAYSDASEFALRLTCYTVTSIYYVGVRLFGGFFYHGNNPA